jgi:hypothetical protein
MSYTINRTDGTLLTELVDGTVDQISSDLTLVGKNASAYGAYINENFVQLLENFANYKAPAKPIQGQLWFDSLEKRLKVFDGYTFKLSAGTIVADAVPSSIAQGDIWIDNKNKQLYFNDGVSTILVGPTSTNVTGYAVEIVLDNIGDPHTIMLLRILTSLVGIFSIDAFTLGDSIAGYARSNIEIGFNFATVSNITYVNDPVIDTDAANKQYVDNSIKIAPLAISLNTTSMVDTHTEIPDLLSKIFPASEHAVIDVVGPICRVVCTNNIVVTVKQFVLTDSVWTWQSDL